MHRQSSQLTTKNLTSTITSTITYWRRNFDIVTYNDNKITNSATTKLLYPPISRITYEQLRIPNFKTRILRTFYQRNPRMPLTRYRCTNNHTFKKLSRLTNTTFIPTQYHSSQTNYYARTTFYASYCVSVTSQKLIVNCYKHERLGNQSFLMWKAFDAFLTTVSLLRKPTTNK